MFDETLEAAILDDPSFDAFSVYGDWFEQRGHARGELIALHIEHARARHRGDKPRAQAFKQRAHAVLARHPDELGRPIANVEPTWHCGFWQSVTIEADAVDLGEVLAHPSARVLRSLRIRSREGFDSATLSRSTAAAVARSATLDGLARMLRNDCDGRAWRPSLPALSRVRLGAASLVLVDRSLGEMNGHAIASIHGLAELHLNTRASSTQSITRAALRALTPLTSSLRVFSASCCATVDDASCALLATFVDLEEVHVAHTAITTLGLGHLSRLPKLRLLDIRGCTLDDHAASVLATFPALQVLRR
jgi:hypothetical protein